MSHLSLLLAVLAVASDERHAELFERALAEGLTSLVVGVSEPGEEPWIGAAGLADVARGVPVTVDSPYHVGSVSKIFTAVATLRLVEEGRLELATHVADVLPEDVLAGLPQVEEVTIEQLLTHTSGLASINNAPEYWDSLIGAGAFDGTRWTALDLLELAKDPTRPPVGRPGSGAHYSDTNYVLLALTVEQLAGMPFREHVTETIFRPLGMTRSYFLSERADDVDDPARPAPVEGYDVLSPELAEVVAHHPDFPRVPYAPPGGVERKLAQSTSGRERNDAAAGVVTTARDLLVFARALLSGDLLGAEALDWLLSPLVDVREASVGSELQHAMRAIRMPYGPLLTLHGDGPGTNALVAWHEDTDTIVVCLTNVFGLWNEHELFRETVVAGVLAGD